ncbi:MAG: hypothetical protein M5U01_23735 [Ardenticatenaceae bacterium]|nr:hypothetical protein [Ardenticatenaceae bacterium]
MRRSLTIQHLDDATVEWIDQEAKRKGVPAEAVARRLIQRGVEVERKRAAQQVHRDLDALAGTWSEEETAEFLRAVEELSQIDPSRWQCLPSSRTTPR